MAERPKSSRARLRQAALVALMMVTGSLVFILPEPNEESFELNSDLGAAIRIGSAEQADDLESPGSESGDDTELALGGDGNQSPYGDGARSADGGEQWTAGEVAALMALPRPTTTVPPTTVEETKPPTTPATTAQPTTTEAVEPAADSDEDGQATSSTDASTEQSTTEADGQSQDSSTTSAPAEGEPAPATDPAEDPDAEPADTGPTEEEPAPATTEPAPTTQPPVTEPAEPVEPGWVDTGNGVLVPPVLLAIRYCESRDNYTAANPSSSARGGYQFLTGSWAAYGHKDRYGVNQAHLASPAQQDEAALITWQRDGTRPWNASRSCWSGRI